MTLQVPAGLQQMGAAQQPMFLRIGVYGYPGSGKTFTSMTWPAPLLINPLAEGGHNTARHPDGSFIVQPVVIGSTHAAFLRDVPGSVSIKVELEQWIEYIYRAALMKQCPWQTIVLGGFSDIATMIYEQAEKEAQDAQKRRGGKEDKHRAWGDVLAWYNRTVHMLFSLPFHVIIEMGCKVTMDKDNRDQVATVEPDLSGRGGKLVLPRELDMLIYTERNGSTFFTHFAPRVSKPVFYMKAPRFLAMSFQQPVQDCSYDVFAQALGLPPIWVCDPGHPRCQQGRWPWSVPWHV
ncbi:MAG: AAA family ATPase [bacterium]